MTLHHDDRRLGRIVRIDAVATAGFTLTAVLAATFFDQPWTTMAVVVSLACFAGGIVAFLWGYAVAVQRSRVDDISVAAMYFLVDGAAPRRTARLLNGLLAAQTLVGLVTALARPSTEGKAGSTLAFGILVPVLGLGLNGLWAARHGTFRPRRRASTAGESSAGQDDGHE